MLLNALEARAVLACALRHRFALLAINADSPAAITDCLEAARLEQAPVIIETSLWQLRGHSFGAGDPILGLTRYLAELAALAQSATYAGLPVIFHTDHIKGHETLRILSAAIRGVALYPGNGPTLRASTLSLDSSELDTRTNVELLCRLCAIGHEAGQPVTLEVEAGLDQGVSPLEEADARLGPVELQHPNCVHLWAPGVGTQHGLGAQTAFSADAVRSHQERASQICGRPIGIALHGSSGLSPTALQAAVAAGAVKVNWSSESLLLRSQAAREFYVTHAAELEKGHPDWKITAMDHGVQHFVATRYVPKVRERIALLGGSGRRDLCLAALRGKV